jgi:nucleotide-binding universal stress UspA family protein
MALFPTKVLVGVDGSTTSAYAVDVARELCAATGSELHLVHVKLTRSSLRGRTLNPPQREVMEDEAEALLERLRRRVEEHGGTVAGAHLRLGERVERELTRAQEELGASLLVISASHSGTLAQRLFKPDDAQSAPSTVRTSPGSVLVVRPPA